MRILFFAPALLAALALSGCDLFGDSAEKLAVARESEGKAIGGACRHAGRAIEDCYTLNKKADKAAVFAGWRDMNDYMRENKIEAVAPQLVAAAKPEGKLAKGEAKGDMKIEKAIALPADGSASQSDKKIVIEKKPAKAEPKNDS
jgi:hypothetical protein